MSFSASARYSDVTGLAPLFTKAWEHTLPPQHLPLTLHGKPGPPAQGLVPEALSWTASKDRSSEEVLPAVTERLRLLVG